MRIEAEIARRLGARRHLLDRPFLSLLRLAMQSGRGEVIEGLVKCRMDGDQLALQMGGKLGDLDAMALGDALDLVAIGLRFCRLLDVEKTPVPAGDLHALIAQACRPFADVTP